MRHQNMGLHIRNPDLRAAEVLRRASGSRRRVRAGMALSKRRANRLANYQCLGAGEAASYCGLMVATTRWRCASACRDHSDYSLTPAKFQMIANAAIIAMQIKMRPPMRFIGK
jgi:hypothetical protein